MDMIQLEQDTIKEIQDLAVKLHREPSREEWMEEYGYSNYRLRNYEGGYSRLRRLALAGEDYVEEEIQKYDLESFNLNDYYKLIKEYTTLEEKRKPSRTYWKTGDPDCDEPIITMFSSDWHLGSLSTDHDKFKEDHDYILSLPKGRVKMFVMGDLIDNSGYFFVKERVFNNLPTDIQKNMLFKLLEEYQEKDILAAAWWGNHDVERDEKLFGYSDIANKLMSICPYFNGKGCLDYVVGKQTYRIIGSHYFRSRSMYHNFQGLLRAFTEEKFDIGVGAHHHMPGYMFDCYSTNLNYTENWRLLIKCGTYHTDDAFANRYYHRGVIGTPCAVLYPNTKKMVPFMELKDAVKYLDIM